MIKAIRLSGTPKAVAAALYFSTREDYGYVSGYTRLHNIGIATVMFPFRENNKEQDFLIPDEGAPVDPQDALNEFKDSRQWRAFLARYPGAYLTGRYFLVDNTVDYHGQQLFYACPVRMRGNHQIIGILTIRFNFDRTGSFQGSEFVGIVN